MFKKLLRYCFPLLVILPLLAVNPKAVLSIISTTSISLLSGGQATAVINDNNCKFIRNHSFNLSALKTRIKANRRNRNNYKNTFYSSNCSFTKIKEKLQPSETTCSKQKDYTNHSCLLI